MNSLINFIFYLKYQEFSTNNFFNEHQHHYCHNPDYYPLFISIKCFSYVKCVAGNIYSRDNDRPLSDRKQDMTERTILQCFHFQPPVAPLQRKKLMDNNDMPSEMRHYCACTKKLFFPYVFCLVSPILLYFSSSRYPHKYF